MKTLSKRLLYALERANMSQSELARVVGIKPQSVQYLCSNNSGGTRSRFITEIAITLGVRPEWLLAGEEPMEGTGLEELIRTPLEDRLAELPSAAKQLVETIMDLSESGTLTEEAAFGLLALLNSIPDKKRDSTGTFEKLRRRARDASRNSR